MNNSIFVGESLTIITPTFNRCATLSRLYESLESQSFPIHEWIVVDDGSIDGTRELIFDFKKLTKNINNLVYICQSNAGKHVALNTGLNRSTGDFICFVDSDDWLTPSCLESFYTLLRSRDVLSRPEISAISGVKTNSSGSLISSLAPESLEMMSHFSWFYIKKRYGDRIDFYKRNAIGDRRFNVFGSEKFLTEDSFWITIPGLKLFANLPMLVGEYLPDGLTAQSNRLLSKNPAGTSFYYLNLVFQFESIGKKPPFKIYALFFYYAFLSIGSKYALRAFFAVPLVPVVALYKKLIRK